MSLSVKVQKDIGSYEEKVVGKLSFRTLLCVVGGIASAIATAAICHFVIGIEVADASLPVMAASLPFWLVGFARPHHMRPEEFLPLWWKHEFGQTRLLYRPTFVSGEGDFRLVGERPSRRARRRSRAKGVEHDEPSRQAFGI